jgi:hypothetical protein
MASWAAPLPDFRMQHGIPPPLAANHGCHPGTDVHARPVQRQCQFGDQWSGFANQTPSNLGWAILRKLADNGLDHIACGMWQPETTDSHQISPHKRQPFPRMECERLSPSKLNKAAAGSSTILVGVQAGSAQSKQGSGEQAFPSSEISLSSRGHEGHL